MTVRIRPRDVTVPEKEVFRDDLLSRDKEIKILSNMFASLEGPCVLAVDAPWGYGKTTFIRLWSQYLQNQGSHVIEFNAWENDFTGSPFVSLLTELKRGIKMTDDNTDDNKAIHGKLLKSVNKLTKYGERIEEISINFHFPGASIGAKLKPAKNMSNEYEEYLYYKEEFRKGLIELSKALRELPRSSSSNVKQYPIVIMIDELDRCRPDYAVQLLEIAKHFFSVDYVMFVLTISSSQLVHSVKSVYGQDFDAQEYLRRFFDIDFKLPNQSREVFIDKLLKESIGKYFDGQKGSEKDTVGLDLIHIKNILKSFFGASDLSLRQISHSIHRLGLIFTSLNQDKPSFIGTTIVALILRTFESELYHDFYQGKVSDAQVIDVISSRPVVRIIQDKEEWRTFVAILILSYCEIKHVSLSDDLSNHSPLMMQYNTNLAASGKNARTEEIMKRVKQLVDQAKLHKKKSPNYSLEKFVGFRKSVDRIEMFSEKPTK